MRWGFGFFPIGIAYGKNLEFPAAGWVPLQIDVEHQTLNDIGTGECYLRGAKVDLEKRQATMQICVCPEEDQLMPPVIIFRNKNQHPDSVFKFPPGLITKKK